MMTATQQSINPSARAHQRTQSAITTPPTATHGFHHPLLASNSAWQDSHEFSKQLRAESTKALPLLPDDHPHANLPLTEFNHNGGRARSSPRKRVQQPNEVTERPLALHKRGKSTLSLKGFAAQVTSKENDQGEEKNKDIAKEKPKKSKSSTNLASLLSRPRSSGKSPTKENAQLKDKENITPPGSAVAAPLTPIWAQFATQPLEYNKSTTKIPLNDGGDYDSQLKLYAPDDPSHMNQRISNDNDRPALKPRPKSTYGGYASATKSAFAETVAGLRKTSSGRNKQVLTKDEASKGRQSHDSPIKAEQLALKPLETNLADNARNSKAAKADRDLEVSKAPSRVKAAVAAWDDKSKQPKRESKETVLDTETIETEFESLLVSILPQEKLLMSMLTWQGCSKHCTRHSK